LLIDVNARLACNGRIMIIEWPRSIALILMLLAVVYGYRKGRNASVVSGQSLAWTNIPLIALAIISIGPSVYAVILYLTYRFGLVQPHAPGYRFGSFVYLLPVDLALINWAFVPLYVVCRTWPKLGAARFAMWFSVVAMSVPGAVLFALAPEMISSAFDSGQGIGIIEAVLFWSPINWPPLTSIIIDAPVAFMFVLMALTGFLPILGLIAWLAGQLVGRVVPKTHSDRESARQNWIYEDMS
jgi:hypothetical protein